MDTLRIGYPEQGGDYPIVTINDVWVATVVGDAAAEELAQFVYTFGAVPPENMGYLPLEEVNKRVRAVLAPREETQHVVES